jgi:hypothetical protein
MTKIIYQYSLRIWLTTLFVSPPIVFIADYAQNVNSIWEKIVGLFLFEGYAIGLGLLFSLPSVILFYFISLHTSKLSTTIQLRKLILILFALIFLFVTFSILLGGINQIYDSKSLRYISAYSLVLVMSLLFYKLPFEKTRQKTMRL